MTRPLILITNDDGIQSLGIKHLWDAIREFADVAIVAPHAEKSGSSLSITPAKPLTTREYPWEDATPAWSVNGTPADCVKMAVSVLLKKQPDLIISGINRGSNAGRTVLYSGTVGGVMEGTLRDIPGIAFSFFEFGFPKVGSVKKYINTIITHFMKHPIPTGSFLNVNFPSGCENGIKGIRMAKQGRSYWLESPDKRMHPEGHAYYWLGGQWSKHEEALESDVDLLKKGYITIAPIQVGDLTDHHLYNQHQETIQNLVF